MKRSFLARRRAVSDILRRRYPKVWPLVVFFQMGVISMAAEMGSFALCQYWLFKPFVRIPFRFWIFEYDPIDGGLATFLAFVVSFAISSSVSFILQRKRTFKANNNATGSAVMYLMLVLASYLFTIWVPPYIMPLYVKILIPPTAAAATRFTVSAIVSILQYPINKYVIMRNKKIVYKAAVFDLDGTLLNSLGDLAAAGNYALEKVGMPTHEVDAYKQFVGSGIPNLVRRMLPPDASPEQYAEALGHFAEYYEKHKTDTTAPYPGVMRLLRRMSRRGIAVAVVSNKDDSPAKALVRGYFGPYVTVIKGRVDGVEVKPNPELVFQAINEMGADPLTTLYIGDSNVDMETAKNAGLDSCGVLWGFRSEQELREAGARYIVDDVYDLGRMFGIN